MRTSRLSYANVASTLALVVALGGGGAAVAAGVAKNSVGTKQLKANAVTSAKVKNDSLTGKDVQESTLGQVPSALDADHADHADHAATADSATTAGRAGNVHAAVVQANGTLVAGQSLDAVSAARQDTGLYEVGFDRNIAGCAATASIAYPGEGFLTIPGQVAVTGLENDPTGLFVVTADLNGSSADMPFAVTVVC